MRQIGSLVRPPILLIALVATLASHTPRGVAGDGPPRPSYTVTDLGALPVAGLDPAHAGQVRADIAYAINARGDVAGEAFIPGGGGFAFLYRDGAVTSLGTLGPSARPTSQARGLNDAGQVVGYYCSDTAFGPFLSDRGGMRDLGTLRRDGKPGYGIAHAVNDAGQVAGEASISPEGHGHAFLWRDGRMTDLGVLSGEPGLASGARGINRRGDVVGYSGLVRDGKHSVRGFLWRAGRGMVALPTLGGRDGQANAISDRGQIVGRSGVRRPDDPPAPDGVPEPPDDRAYHAFLYEAGAMRDLGTLGGRDSEALAVNASGQIVGWSLPETGGLPPGTLPAEHAFLYAGGRMDDLNRLIPADSGWLLLRANGINDKGQIVGEGSIGGKRRAFLLTPGR